MKYFKPTLRIFYAVFFLKINLTQKIARTYFFPSVEVIAL